MPQSIPIEKRGEKLLISSTSRNKTPTEFLSISENARIKDSTITKRRGQKVVVTSSIWTENKWITYNKDLFVAANSLLNKVDLTAWTLTSIGSIWVDTIVNFINYWKYIVILTWSGKPYVYDGTTLTLTTTTAPDVDPIIWERFTGFTFIVWNTTDKENVLYISRPILEASQERCYDWIGTDSETITFDSKILWLVATLNQLFIFTENRIEYVGKNSLQTIWGVASLISTPIGDGWQLASYRSVVSAGNKVFYLTKNKTINTLNYASWTIDPEIWVLTDEPVFKITKYLDNLDDDQSTSFGFFDEWTKTIHWFLKKIWSLYNDTVLIYDIENATRTTDTKRFYNDAIAYNNKVYAGSSINSNVIQDGIGLDDDWQAIEFKIEDTDISLWTIVEKLFQWWETSWWVNKLATINITTYIDDVARAVGIIDWDDYFVAASWISALWSIWWTTVWWTAIGWLQSDNLENIAQFDKILNHSWLYARGKRIRRRFEENTIGSDFYLDLYTIYADVTGNIELSDLF